MKKTHNKVTSLFEPTILLPAVIDSFKKLDPPASDQEPGDVCGLSRQPIDYRIICPSVRGTW